jgi:hypothetical protein
MEGKALVEKVRIGASELRVSIAGSGLLPRADTAACCCCCSSCRTRGTR